MRRKLRKVLVKCTLLGTLCLVVIGVLNVGLAMVEELRQRVVDIQYRSQLLTNRRFHQSDKYDALVSSYMNSGSSFTAGLLGMRSDAFYFYEPLWHLAPWEYFRSNSTVCSMRALSCRTLSTEQLNRNTPDAGMPVDFQILHDNDILQPNSSTFIPQRILEHVYNCEMKKLQNVIRPEVTAQFSGQSWFQYRRCIQRKYPREECLNHLQLQCLSAQHRVTKVLRLTLGAVDQLLSKFPRLKVIHLFRDPRAIINSRAETHGYPLAFHKPDLIEVNSKVLCDKMALDLYEGRQLQKKFPFRFRFVHYEDIYMNDSSLVKLHSDFGMSLTRGNLFRAKIGKKNEAVEQSSEKVQLRREDNAFWWRQNMAYDTVAIVNKVCLHICLQLGYPLIQNSRELRHYNASEDIRNLRYLL